MARRKPKQKSDFVFGEGLFQGNARRRYTFNPLKSRTRANGQLFKTKGKK